MAKNKRQMGNPPKIKRALLPLIEQRTRFQLEVIAKSKKMRTKSSVLEFGQVKKRNAKILLTDSKFMAKSVAELPNKLAL